MPRRYLPVLVIMLLAAFAFITPQKAKAADKTYTLTLVNGKIKDTGKTTGQFKAYELVTVVPDMPEGYVFNNWYSITSFSLFDNEGSMGYEAPELRFFMPESDMELEAQKHKTLKMFARTESGQSLNANSVVIPIGESVLFTATLNGEPVSFQNLSGMKNCSGGDFNYEFPDPYTMKITATSSGDGWMEWNYREEGNASARFVITIIMGNAGECMVGVMKGTGSGTFHKGDIVKLVADPAPEGEEFDYWSFIQASFRPVNGYFHGEEHYNDPVYYVVPYGGALQCMPVYKTIRAWKLTLNKSSLTLKEGESFQLTAAKTPSTAVNDRVYWFSSDYDVVKVNQDTGLITALSGADGKTATISAMTRWDRDEKYRIWAYCKVTVSNTGSSSGGSGSGGSGSGSSGSTSEDSDRVAMYRLYNPNSGEHFYTARVKERNHLKSIGWRYEGIGWYAPKYSNTPVYRLYNANAGDHHYTMKAGEMNALVKIGWKYEGIGWYSDDQKGVPLYRQYNPNAVSGSHNYTTRKKENDYLVTIGWREEGIGWYGLQ